MPNIRAMSPEQRIAAVVYAVRANSFETLSLWKEHDLELDWDGSSSGQDVTVGNVGDDSIVLNLMFHVIAGQVVLFYNATSQVVDYRIVDAWLATNVPAIRNAAQPRDARTDANNFHRCTSMLREQRNAAMVAAVTQELAVHGWTRVHGGPDAVAYKVLGEEGRPVAVQLNVSPQIGGRFGRYVLRAQHLVNGENILKSCSGLIHHKDPDPLLSPIVREYLDQLSKNVLALTRNLPANAMVA